MKNRKIDTIDDIKLLVDKFYDKVKVDELIGPVFHDVIGEDWTEHLDKMYRFWQTVLLHEYTYKGSPFMKHMELPVEKKHFDRWLNLFYETVDEYFEGRKAIEAKSRAMKMAHMFQHKIKYYNEKSTKPLQ